jgi:hypothetical protein
MYSDLKPLIALLEKASASTNASEQLATIELGLVAAELSPECYEFVELLTGIKLISELNTAGRVWNNELADLVNSEGIY